MKSFAADNTITLRFPWHDGIFFDRLQIFYWLSNNVNYRTGSRYGDGPGPRASLPSLSRPAGAKWHPRPRKVSPLHGDPERLLWRQAKDEFPAASLLRPPRPLPPPDRLAGRVQAALPSFGLQGQGQAQGRSEAHAGKFHMSNFLAS